MIEPGELAALCAALMWTLSSMLWGRLKLSAMDINLCKNWIGSALLLGHLAIASLVIGQPMFSADTTAWCWLGLSGLIGIVIGDTLYFRSLQILGPRLALIMACTSPIFATLLGWLFLGEQPGLMIVSGVMLTVIGVIVVVMDRKAKAEAPGIVPGAVGTAIMCGLSGAVCQAIGGVCSKSGMESCSPLEATFIRLAVSAIATMIIVMASGRLRELWKLAREKANWQILIPATALGTWLGIWLSQIAYKGSDLAIAQTLLSTCPLFAIPIVWYFHGHRVTIYSIVGTIVALLGIYFTLK